MKVGFTQEKGNRPMSWLNTIIPILGSVGVYYSRFFWYQLYQTLGIVGSGLIFSVFLGICYWVHLWTIRVTAAATSHVVVDDNGKITCTNWGHCQSYNPSELIQPRTLEELQTLIKTRKHKHVKPFGALHSWSACFKTDGIAVDMKQLNRVIKVDPENMTVKAEAGIMLKDFFEALKPHKMAIATMPNVNMITLGGAVSNGTHGTNIQHGTFASLVDEIEIVTANGDLLTLRANSSDQTERDRFDAAVISFGCLGIIYSLTMKCIPEYNMIIYRETASLQHYMKNVVEISHNWMSSMTVILPSIGEVMIKTQSRIKPLGADAVTMKTGHSFSRVEVLGAMLVHIGLDFLPSAVVRLIKMYPMMKWKWSGITVVPWDQAEQLPHTKRFINMEYAMPESIISEAIKFVSELIARYAREGKYFRQMAWCVRPVGSDSRGFLSSTRREDGKPTYYIDIPYQQSLDKDEVEFYKELEKGLLNLGGRVSFSRLFWNYSPSVLRNFPEREKFIAVKKDLDPDNVFTNKLVNSVLFGEDPTGEYTC